MGGTATFARGEKVEKQGNTVQLWALFALRLQRACEER
jgi:hypothetical protein